MEYGIKGGNPQGHGRYQAVCLQVLITICAKIETTQETAMKITVSWATHTWGLCEWPGMVPNFLKVNYDYPYRMLSMHGNAICNILQPTEEKGHYQHLLSLMEYSGGPLQPGYGLRPGMSGMALTFNLLG